MKKDIFVALDFSNFDKALDVANSVKNDAAGIKITNELFANDSYVEVIRIDDFMDGGFSEYDQNISDHRPVALKLTFDTIISGDINNDGIINVLDVITLVNGILNGGFSEDQLIIADLNEDGIINVIDIVLLVNLNLN